MYHNQYHHLLLLVSLLAVVLFSVSVNGVHFGFNSGLSACSPISNDAQCRSSGYSVADCVNQKILGSNPVPAWKKRAEPIPPVFLNSEYAHFSVCTVKDADGDDEHHVAYAFSNESTYGFVNKCPKGAYWATTSILIVPKYNVSGIVTDNLQAPIASATVTVGDVSVITGVDGSYVIESLKNGTYDLLVSANGYTDFITSVTVGGSNLYAVNFELTPTPSAGQLALGAYIVWNNSSLGPLWAQSAFMYQSACMITEGEAPCACAASEYLSLSFGDILVLRNATGCGEPGVYAVHANPSDVDADVTAVLVKYTGENYDIEEPLGQWTRNTAEFRSVGFWRIWSLSVTGQITIHDDVLFLIFDGLW